MKQTSVTAHAYIAQQSAAVYDPIYASCGLVVSVYLENIMDL
jgi:hypothetical protein